MCFNRQHTQIPPHNIPTKIRTYHHYCHQLVTRSIHVIRPIWSIISKNCARFVVTKCQATIMDCLPVNHAKDSSNVQCKIKRYTHALLNDSVISIKHSENDAHSADSKNAWKLAWNLKVSTSHNISKLLFSPRIFFLFSLIYYSLFANIFGKCVIMNALHSRGFITIEWFSEIDLDLTKTSNPMWKCEIGKQIGCSIGMGKSFQKHLRTHYKK